MAKAGVSSAVKVNQQKTLKEIEQEIINLVDIEYVLPPLQRLGILTYIDIDDIGRQTTKAKKVREFIARLLKRGDKAFPSLIAVLRESETEKHKQLADKLVHFHPPAVQQSSVTKTVVGKLQDHETRIKNLEDVRRATEKAEQLKKQLESKEAELGQAKANANELKEENVKLNKRIDDLEVEVKDLREKKDQAEKELEDMKEQMAEIKEKNNDLQQKVDMLQQAQKETTEKTDNLQQELQQSKQELQQSKQETKEQINEILQQSKQETKEQINEILQQSKQETKEQINELMKKMMMDKADNKGRKSTTVSVLPPIVSRNRFENGPVQTRGGARKPAEGGGARKPAEGGGARKPAEGGGARKPAEEGGARKPAEGGGRGSGAINPRR